MAESATWSSGSSSVDIMTILSTAFDSTPIYDTTFVEQSVFNARLYFLGEKNCVKSVDFGQECAEKVPKIAKSVDRHRRLFGGSSSSASSGLIPKGATYVLPTECFHYYIKSRLHAHWP